MAILALNCTHLTHRDKTEPGQIEILIVQAVVVKDAMAEPAVASAISNADDGEAAAHACDKA